MRRLAVIGILFLHAAAAYAFEADLPAPDKVILYYFHTNTRTVNCRLIEAYARASVEERFASARDGGRLEFLVVNIEAPGNEHYIHDYRLYTKGLALSLVKSGKERTYKKLGKIWTYLADRDASLDYLAGEIDGFLREIG